MNLAQYLYNKTKIKNNMHKKLTLGSFVVFCQTNKTKFFAYFLILLIIKVRLNH